MKSDAAVTDCFVFTTFRNCNDLFLCSWLHITLVLKYCYIKSSCFWLVCRECRSGLFIYRCSSYRGYWHPNSFYSLHSIDSNISVVTGLIQLLIAVEILLHSKFHEIKHELNCSCVAWPTMLCQECDSYGQWRWCAILFAGDLLCTTSPLSHFNSCFYNLRFTSNLFGLLSQHNSLGVAYAWLCTFTEKRY